MLFAEIIKLFARPAGVLLCAVVVSCSQENGSRGQLTETSSDPNARHVGASPKEPDAPGGDKGDFTALLNEALSLAENDLDAAFEHLRRAYSGDNLGAARRFLIYRVAEKWPAKTPQLLEHVQDPSERDAVLSPLGEQLSRKPLEEVTAIASKLSPRERDLFLGGLARGLTRAGSFTRAAQFLDEIENNDELLPGIALLVQHWAAARPEEAESWAVALKSEAARVAALNSLVHTLGSTRGTDAVVDLINRIDDESVRLAGIKEVVRAMVRSGHAASAASWINSLQSDARRSGMTQLVDSVAASDPQGSIKLASSVDDEDLRRNLVATAVLRVAHDKPQLAAELLLEREADEFDDRAVTHLINVWYMRDKAALIKWLNDLPPGHLRDRSYHVFSDKVRSSDPAIRASHGR